MDHGEPEMQALFPRDLLDDSAGPRYMRRRAGRADNHRNAAAASRAQHQTQIALHRFAVGEGNTGAEIIRPGVGRSRVDREHVGVALQSVRERRLRESVTENRRRRKYPQFIPMALVRCRHIKSVDADVAARKRRGWGGRLARKQVQKCRVRRAHRPKTWCVQSTYVELIGASSSRTCGSLPVMETTI